MAKDGRKSSADARLDKLEAALRRERHEQEQRRLAARLAAGPPAVTHLPNGRPVGIRIDDEPAPVHKKLASPPKHSVALQPTGLAVGTTVELQAVALAVGGRQAATVAHVRKLIGKKWVEKEFERRRHELLAMHITDAAIRLAEESGSAKDCVKHLTPRYVENVLRTFDEWPLAYRNSPKKRRKKRPHKRTA